MGNDAAARFQNIQKAVEKFSKKNDPSKPKRATKNSAPEKDFVKEVMIWLDTHSFSCHVVESRAVFNPKIGRYLSSQAVPGFPDIVGCDQYGRSVWIEVKAPGKRSTVKPHQLDFLKGKIANNCFAVCIDSIQDLSTWYKEWMQVGDGRQYLLSKLY